MHPFSPGPPGQVPRSPLSSIDGALPTPSPLAGIPIRRIPVFPYIKDAGVSQTIAEMISIAKGCSQLDQFREMGRDALQENPGDIQGIYEWVQAMTQGYLSFQTDDSVLPSLGLPTDAQLVLTPDLVLANPGIKGACGSYSTFCATLLLATNLPIDIYFTTLASDPEDLTEFSHVYVTVVGVDGERVAIDCSHGTHVGWEYPKWARKRNWLIHKGTNYPSISGDESMNSYNNLQKVRGLGEIEGYHDVVNHGGSLGDIDWGGILAGAAGAGEKIAINETLPATTYRAQNPDGSYVTYSIPQGQAGGIPNLAGMATGLSSISPMVWILGLGLVAIFALKK